MEKLCPDCAEFPDPNYKDEKYGFYCSAECMIAGLKEIIRAYETKINRLSKKPRLHDLDWHLEPDEMEF